MYNFYMGIDPSFTSSGLVILSSDGNVFRELNIKTASNETTEERILFIEKKINDLISDLDFSKIIVGIEGPSFMSKGNALLNIGALNYYLRIFLFKNKIKYIVIPPKKLVKFVIGRGNGSKALMLKYVYKKWGYDTEIDDLADAYSLARYVFEEYKG